MAMSDLSPPPSASGRGPPRPVCDDLPRMLNRHEIPLNDPTVSVVCTPNPQKLRALITSGEPLPRTTVGEIVCYYSDE